MAWPAATEASRLAHQSTVVERLLHAVTARHTLALIDQAVVSGASFATTIMIGRYTDPAQLGVYALANSVLIWMVVSQEALVSLPYTLRLYRTLDSPAEQAGSALLLSLALSTVAGGTIAAAAVMAFVSNVQPDTLALIGVLAAAAPFIVHRDFARRFAFAHLKVGEALALDCLAAVLQLGTIAWLVWTETLSSATALAAIASSSAVAGLTWLWLVRTRFRLAIGPTLDALRESWCVGKWLFANQLLPALQSQLSFWLVAMTTGTAGTGLYAACMSISLLANPIILGLSNVLWPRAARALHDGGRTSLLREAIRDAVLIGTVVGVFCLGLLVGGEAVLGLLFSRGEYAGYGTVVAVLAFGQLAFGLGLPASCALSALGFVRMSCLMALAEAALTSVLVCAMGAGWGVPGAAYAVLIASSTCAVARWLIAMQVLRGAASRFPGAHAPPQPEPACSTRVSDSRDK